MVWLLTWRMKNTDKWVHVAFQFGKARVAPLKPITIPWLELTAAVVAVRVDKMLHLELQLPLKRTCFWTDSMSVRKYIKNENWRFQTIVANRVTAIRDNLEIAQWRYIPTFLNPANDASRGLKAEDLVKRRWIEGPEFLRKPEEVVLLQMTLKWRKISPSMQHLLTLMPPRNWWLISLIGWD